MSKVMFPSEVQSLRAALLDWFDSHRRDLPWRRTRDPYAIWVSETMLQQTQVATVIPYYHRFLGALPTVQALAEAPLDRVLGLWAGLGYYHRARNLHAAAQRIVSEHGGQFPAEVGALRALPGIGEYTAGAIASTAFGQRVAAVDGNVNRVLCRVAEIAGDPGRKPARGMVRSVASWLVDCARPGDVNQALMELGATRCRPTTPNCAACPVQTLCGAARSGRQAELPERAARAAREQRHTAAAVICREGGVLLAQRPATGVWAGLWEFPQTEVTDGEAPQALVAHLAASLGMRARVERHLLRLRHGVMNTNVTLDVYECRVAGKRVESRGYVRAAWVPLAELEAGTRAMSAPHGQIARQVVVGFS